MDQYPVVCMKCGVTGKISGATLASVSDPKCPGCGSTDIDLDQSRTASDKDKDYGASPGAGKGFWDGYAGRPAASPDDETYMKDHANGAQNKADDEKPVTPGSYSKNVPIQMDEKTSAIAADIRRHNPELPIEAVAGLATRVAGQYLAAYDSYDSWLQAVDDAVARKVGLSIHDLEDVPLMDWYEDGVSPASAASRAIKNSGGAF